MTDWTEEMFAELDRLWRTDKSIAEIADELGIGKNILAGKVFRMKERYPQRAKVERRKPVRSHSKVKIRAPKLTLVKTPDKPPQPQRIDPRPPRLCVWPVAENGRRFVFCGAECEQGKPYCSLHCKTAYRRAA